MKRINLIYLFTVLYTNSIVAQTLSDSIVTLNLDKIAQVNQEESYVTFPFDIGNLEPLMFEANVSPNFKIRERVNRQQKVD